MTASLKDRAWFPNIESFSPACNYANSKLPISSMPLRAAPGSDLTLDRSRFSTKCDNRVARAVMARWTHLAPGELTPAGEKH